MTEYAVCKNRHCRRRLPKVRIQGGRCPACRGWWRSHGKERPNKPVRFRHDQANPDTCLCTGCTARRQVTRGQRWDAWLPEHDQALITMVGRYPRYEIARILTEEFLVPRSVPAVCRRAYALGLDIADTNTLTATTVAAICAVSECRARTWIKGGLLKAGNRPNGHYWNWIKPDDLYTFLREHVYAYDWRKMPKGAWRDYAQTAAMRDVWYSVDEVATRLGRSERAVRNYLERGRLQGQRRHGAGAGSPRWFVRRSEIERFERERQHAKD